MKIIKTLFHHSWGANKNSHLTVYKSLILSKIDYGFIIYNSAKPSVTKMTDPIHNEGIRLSIDAFRTSPVNSILCIASEPLSHIRRNKEILIYILKKKFIQHHITSKIFASDSRSNKPSQYNKINDAYKKLSGNFTFNINLLSPFNTVPSWKRHPNIITQLLSFNKKHSLLTNKSKIH